MQHFELSLLILEASSCVQNKECFIKNNSRQQNYFVSQGHQWHCCPHLLHHVPYWA